MSEKLLEIWVKNANNYEKCENFSNIQTMYSTSNIQTMYSTVMMLLNIVIRVFLASPTIHDKNAMLILYMSYMS